MGVSLLMATYNRGSQLAWTLKALHMHTRPDEIIVVDDGGTDHTHAVCAAYLEPPIRYVYNNHPGETNRCHASNVGLRMARHDEVLVCDAEIEFLTDVVGRLLHARERVPNDVLTAEICWREPWTGSHKKDWIPTPGGNVGLYKREWLMDIRGWDEALEAPTGYDDVDLHARLMHAGHVQRAIPGVEVRHQWHAPLPMNDPNHPLAQKGLRNANEIRISAKAYPEDIVANQGIEWGWPCRRSDPPLISKTCGGGGCGCL